jgi:hypothetical protein
MKIEIEIGDENVIANIAVALKALAGEYELAANGMNREPMPLTVLRGLYEHFSTAYYLIANASYAEEIDKAIEGDRPSPV